MTEPELEYKPDFAEARSRWDALWQHDIVGRPCTLVTAKRLPNGGEQHRVVAVDADFQAVVQEADLYLESHAFLGEAMPAFRPGFGPDQMAAFLGAPLKVSPDSLDTSWSEKVVDDWESFLPLQLSVDNYSWQRMREYHAIAARHFRGRCLISEIDMHSNIDMLEGLRGAQKLLYDMIDDPETILSALHQAREIYRKVQGELYQYGDKARLGTTSWLHMYDRGVFNTIQADFIALLNPRMFRRFVLPAIEDELTLLDRSCFHLDGPDALTHLDDLLALKDLDAIQWVPGAGRSPQIEWPDLLHRIQSAGKIIILHLSADEVRRIHGEYRPELLVYDVHTASVVEGERLLDWLNQNT